MPKFVIAQIRRMVSLEIRTIEADTPLDAVTAPDDAGAIEQHIIQNHVEPVTDLIPADKADDAWKGMVIHMNSAPKMKGEKIASPEHAKRPQKQAEAAGPPQHYTARQG